MANRTLSGEKEGVLWASGYYIASVSDGATTDMVQEYIETQHDREIAKTNAGKIAQSFLFAL